MLRMPLMMERALKGMRSTANPGGAGGIVAALGLVAVVTFILEVVKTFIELPPIAITYLIPVLIAAIRWGYLSAMVTTLAGAVCSAFFFYRPLHTIYVEDPARRLSLTIFAIVAVVASHLAVRMRRESEIVRKREKEIHDLYAFSRRLAAGHSTSEIFDAIQKHLSAVVGRKVALFEPRRRDRGPRRPRHGRNRDRGPSRESLAGARRVAQGSRSRRDRHRSRAEDARVGGGDWRPHRGGAARRGVDAGAARARARPHRGEDAGGVGALPRRPDRLGVARAAHAALVDPGGGDRAAQRARGRRRPAPRGARQRGARRIGTSQQRNP